MKVHPEVSGREHLTGALYHAGLPRLDLDQEGHGAKLGVRKPYSKKFIVYVCTL